MSNTEIAEQIVSNWKDLHGVSLSMELRENLISAIRDALQEKQQECLKELKGMVERSLKPNLT